MKLKCAICETYFDWDPVVLMRGAARKPTICGSRGEDGKWKANPECAKERQRIQYREWKKNNREKVKEYARRQYFRRKQLRLSQKVMKYDKPEYDKPKPAKKYYCQYPGCKKLTARNGQNRFYCQLHWDRLQDNCSFQYDNFIYENIENADIDR